MRLHLVYEFCFHFWRMVKDCSSIFNGPILMYFFQYVVRSTLCVFVIYNVSKRYTIIIIRITCYYFIGIEIGISWIVGGCRRYRQDISHSLLNIVWGFCCHLFLSCIQFVILVIKLLLILTRSTTRPINANGIYLIWTCNEIWWWWCAWLRNRFISAISVKSIAHETFFIGYSIYSFSLG